MVNKGKYLAFTEEGTTIPGTEISTGVDYMVNLGVNYVHLLPVYDINSVDETTGGYNWGYDPCSRGLLLHRPLQRRSPCYRVQADGPVPA